MITDYFVDNFLFIFNYGRINKRAKKAY